MTTKTLLRISDVAEILDVTTARAYELARDGTLPVVRLGRQYRVDPDRLQEWLDNGGKPLPGGWKRDVGSEAA